ncbi:MAG: 50S ribosomal protein L3 [Nitrospirae bacterium]|nr:MAG: 50S ribosomal protein L3 [Nitrospirota bacterium]
MVNGLIGRKLGMTQIFDEERCALPVTVIQAGPCGVTALKTQDRDGYEAVQLGFEEVPERKLAKPQVGHLRAAGQNRLWRHLREFRGAASCQVGQILTADLFKKGERVAVQGISKGKGFQGVMKRHHYGGGPASHGSMFHRAPGSIGSSSFPSRVWKNKGLPGHMGHRRVTVKGLTVVDVRPEENLLFVKGAVPGPSGGLVVIRKMKE